MSVRELIGKVAIQTVPGALGALLARSQLGGGSRSQDKDDPSYSAELFLMGVGALFLSLNVAPTEEMQELGLMVASLLVMQSFVYAVDFRGGTKLEAGVSLLTLFLRFTVVGYVVVLIVSLYILWTFGRTDGTALEEIVSSVVVLGFPGAVGAAAARLVL